MGVGGDFVGQEWFVGDRRGILTSRTSCGMTWFLFCGKVADLKFGRYMLVARDGGVAVRRAYVENPRAGIKPALRDPRAQVGVPVLLKGVEGAPGKGESRSFPGLRTASFFVW